ncbi:hemolysin XhlA family protein [Dyadobacter sp. LJ53]|uniref:hemolysin XhlA family protein n=1 Tax=Dyadobacter chenwenxiniae TaxID=2906456 RepID=UPI001F3CE778|nr:hemolysin XhlA family protein [Dyadobacter chenwenxiniae]MCF0053018.1 hemolysin XhlA family protein [Dyadobacter chenwenxiniae]
MNHGILFDIDQDFGEGGQHLVYYSSNKVTEMFLEERVEQLEHLAVDQGKQIEIIATGLATLTTEVRDGFAYAKQKFIADDERFERIGLKFDQFDTRIGRVEIRLDKMEGKIDKLETRVGSLEAKVENLEIKMDKRFDAMNQRFSEMSQQFGELVTLIKRQ